MLDNEIFHAEFKLADGRLVRVNWVNGPPYLSIAYSKEIEVKCSTCKGDSGDRGGVCFVCKGKGVIKVQSFRK